MEEGGGDNRKATPTELRTLSSRLYIGGFFVALSLAKVASKDQKGRGNIRMCKRYNMYVISDGKIIIPKNTKCQIFIIFPSHHTGYMKDFYLN